ncbi:hypothetical protein F441_03312 [Phytophthora nicotianae CJ01A1]|uniref:Ig-like domain-containing protein n=4 Tax=Phytophthora nicotianae TaxID=4792 RepID=V9FQL1_PHYNI|nr:hypothetical protein F443_03332 [Phytophthora nicotianae P1569]ETK93647.1 hypothetical protein L915_03201 [Phytophthora nicotianae]ETO82456.1 hypothetical protein F444_03396 [Phytophthora nicotianae P1976]ETP23582.1 hypothetical protein F441_03312 [Phytophthora nicotianae CJ01A1]ETL47046.1 hypothetical protein L916_03165 [Phytophthora nicotianae]
MGESGHSTSASKRTPSTIQQLCEILATTVRHEPPRSSSIPRPYVSFLYSTVSSMAATANSSNLVSISSIESTGVYRCSSECCHGATTLSRRNVSNPRNGSRCRSASRS